MASMEERNKTLVLEAFNALFNKRDYEAPLQFVSAAGMSPFGRFCCKSRLRQAAKRDSVVLTRISARSIHDGPSEE